MSSVLTATAQKGFATPQLVFFAVIVVVAFAYMTLHYFNQHKHVAAPAPAATYSTPITRYTQAEYAKVALPSDWQKGSVEENADPIDIAPVNTGWDYHYSVISDQPTAFTEFEQAVTRSSATYSFNDQSVNPEQGNCDSSSPGLYATSTTTNLKLIVTYCANKVVVAVRELKI